MTMPADVIYAGELRAFGCAIEASIPDCAWVERSAMRVRFGPSAVERDTITLATQLTFSKPFQWLEVTIHAEKAA